MDQLMEFPPIAIGGPTAPGQMLGIEVSEYDGGGSRGREGGF
jgi:hypothetical protein